MDLDKVAAELRRREGAEAMDLGLLLGRRFYGAILRPWLALVVPILIAVQTVLAVFIAPWAGVLAAWWLKPLFDRLTLYVVSRRFFGDAPSTREVLGEVFKQWRSLDAVADLTWRRLSPSRSMTMPIRILERAGGSKARKRIRSLYDLSTRALGWGLLFAGLTFTALFFLAVAAVVVMVVPVEAVASPLAPLEYLVRDADQWIVIPVLVSTTTVVFTLVEPFYAAGGFGIYIQRRIEREGWDLELRFRRLAERLKRSLDGSATVVAIVFAGLFAGLATVSAPAVAQESTAGDAPDATYTKARKTTDRSLDRGAIPVDDPQAELDEILDSAPFSPEPYTEEKWVRIEENDEENQSWLDRLLERFREIELPDWIGGTGSVVAELLRILMWILAIAAVGFAIWKIVNRVRSEDLTRSEARTRWKEELAEESPGLTVPDGEATGGYIHRLWRRGQHREALAILLVESLVEFESHYDFEFPVGWTISRCGREVRDIRPQGAVLAEASRMFAALAWAGIEPNDEEFEQLVERWESAFEARGGGR